MNLWAKYDKESGRHHLLIHHLADVAAVAEALISLPLWREKLARLAGVRELSLVSISRLCFFAALHDLGKCNAGFQKKIRGNGSGGHVGVCVYLFDDRIRDRALQSLNFEHWARWCEDPEKSVQLLLASISHHGRPIDRPSRYDRKDWLTENPDPLEALKSVVRQISEWFPAAFDKTDQLLPANPRFQHVFNGLVTLADWLGSDTSFFPFLANPETDRIEFSRKKAEQILELIGIAPQKYRSAILKNLPDFQQMFGYEKPRPLQSQISRLEIGELGDPIETEGSIAILEAETGSGKTEAAFLHFERLFRSGKVDGIYFALPTRAAATQIYERISGYVHNLFGKNAPPVVQAVPGYIRVDREEPEGKLAPFQYLWPDQDRFRYRGWAGEHPKRYLAGAVAVGTVDQILLSVLEVSHAQMRLTALSRLLLVIDEVHASSIYMGRLLEEVLHRHTAAGGHALLLSATLGTSAWNRYLFPSRNPIPKLEDSIARPYPAISIRDGENPPEIKEIKKGGGSKEVEIEILSQADDHSAVAELALRKVRKGGRVLVLRNLVKDVIRTQMAVEDIVIPENEKYLFHCHGVIAPHHGRYAAEDRKLLDREVEKYFGKKGEDIPGLLVASRTVEQSLDIDFDLIITDLAPIDILLQRIGRLHRHQRNRPEEFKSPRIIVLTPPDRDLSGYIIDKGQRRGEAKGAIGMGTIFDSLFTVEATWRLLEEYPRIKIPEMNRILVEKATHPQMMEDIKNERGGVWEEHFNKVIGIMCAGRGASFLAMFDWDEPFGEIRFAGLEEKISTRLGENDRIATFPEVRQSPFGNQLKSLRLPGWMVRDCSDDELIISEVEVSDGIITFSVCGRQFIYDRLGLRKKDV